MTPENATLNLMAVTCGNSRNMSKDEKNRFSFTCWMNCTYPNTTTYGDDRNYLEQISTFNRSVGSTERLDYDKIDMHLE